jgi:hypothetical protein
MTNQFRRQTRRSFNGGRRLLGGKRKKEKALGFDAGLQTRPELEIE